jgi:hypothetical protein
MLSPAERTINTDLAPFRPIGYPFGMGLSVLDQWEHTITEQKFSAWRYLCPLRRT